MTALRSKFMPSYSSSEESDSSDDEKPWKRRCNKAASEQETFVNPLAGKKPNIKASKFKVWSSVLTDQNVTGELGSFDIVESKKSDTLVDRGPESFKVTAEAVKKLYPDAEGYEDLDKAEDEMDTDEEKSADEEDGDDFMSMLNSYKKAKDQWEKTPKDLREKIHEKRKRKHDDLRNKIDKKRNERDEVNLHAVFTSDARFQSDVPRASVLDPPETVLKCVMDTLEEKNHELFGKILEGIGNEKALELLDRTEEVENGGGLMIHTGVRRRTPGGVYIQLLKNDPVCSPELKKELFPPPPRDKEKRKRNKKEARRLKRIKAGKIKADETPDNLLDLEVNPGSYVVSRPDVVEMTLKGQNGDDALDVDAEEGELVSD